jgi:hypothetical protein
MIAETDKDGSGSVDFDEFLQASKHAQTDAHTGWMCRTCTTATENTCKWDGWPTEAANCIHVCVLVWLQRARAEMAWSVTLCPACWPDSSCSCTRMSTVQVASKKQQLPYSKADVLRSFRMFADRGAPPGCIVPETLEAALVSVQRAPRMQLPLAAVCVAPCPLRTAQVMRLFVLQITVLHVETHVCRPCCFSHAQTH